MKYLFFLVSLLAVLPLTMGLLFDRRLIRTGILLIFLPLFYFDGTAINFFSHEFYRGTSRGMEVSLIYIMALSVSPF